MRDEEKTREQLLSELSELRWRNTKLEALEIERKKAEETLLQSQRILQSVIDNLPQAVFWKDRNSVYQGCNRRFALAAGIDSPEAVIGKTDDELPWKKEEAEVFRRCDDRVMTTGRSEHHIIESQLRESGKPSWLDIEKIPLHDEQGNVVGTLGIYEDISDHIRIEETVREGKERYESLFINNHAVMLLIDPESGSIIDANPAACRFYGYSQEELTSRKVTEINSLSPEEVFEEIRKARLEQRHHFFFRHRLANGEMRDVEVYSGPIRLSNRQLLYSIIHDITERRRAEEALQKAHDELEQKVKERTATLVKAYRRLYVQVRERRQAEKRLKEAKEKYLLIFENSPLGIVHFDGNGTVTACNDISVKIFGSSHEKLIGFNLPTSLRDAEMRSAIAACLSGKPGHYEGYYHSVTGGRTAYIKADFRPIFSDTGAVMGGTGIIEDISHRKQINDRLLEMNEQLKEEVEERTRKEQSLRESSQLLKAILESTADGILAVNEKGKVIGVNTRFAEMWHIPEELLETKDDLSLLQYASRQLQKPQAFLSRVQALYASSKESSDTLYFRDGRIFEHFSRPLIYDGKPTGRVWNFRDVTERRRAEEALRESEKKYRGTFENAPLGIFQSIPEGRFLDVNEAMARILGYASPSDLLTTITDIGSQLYVDPDQRKTVIEAILQHEDPFRFEAQFYRKDKQIIIVSLAAWVSRNEKGDIRYIEGFLEDITLRKQMEEELKNYTAKLEESNRDLQEFAFVASHDLQEPLRKIQAFGERLELKYRDLLDDTGRDYLERMVNAAGRMSVLIQALLDYSRVATRTQPFRKVDLNRLIQEVLSDFELRIRETEAHIELGKLTTLEIDPIQMQQLFQNLISNGLKFHRKENPIIRIYGRFSEEYSSGGKWFQIFVEDNGIGFDEKHLDRIFKPFQRLHGRSEYEGTGIGLAICRKIAERHGGILTAESKPGKGSTFIISLPVKRSEQ